MLGPYEHRQPSLLILGVESFGERPAASGRGEEMSQMTCWVIFGHKARQEAVKTAADAIPDIWTSPTLVICGQGFDFTLLLCRWPLFATDDRVLSNFGRTRPSGTLQTPNPDGTIAFCPELRRRKWASTPVDWSGRTSLGSLVLVLPRLLAVLPFSHESDVEQMRGPGLRSSGR